MNEFNKAALLNSAKRINVSYFKEQQEDAINAIWQWWQSSSITFTLSGYAGTGKALLDGTKILTIDGWRNIEDTKIGDKVAVPTGGFYPVSAVYHHSDRPLYKITFKDGRSIICDENHLWQVRSKRLIQKYHESNGDYTRYSYTKTTKELYDELKDCIVGKVGYKYAIPLCVSPGFTKSFVIHPYVLGVLLGDGVLTNNLAKHINTRLYISSNEKDIIEKIANILQCSYDWHNNSNFTNSIYGDNIPKIDEALRNYNLRCTAINKYIPKEYLFADIDQRLDLLKGLIDTDGHIKAKGQVSYSTISKQLKDDIITLCNSLGICATVYEDTRKDNICYDIRIITNDIIFSSKKHFKIYNEVISKTKHWNDHLFITSIEALNKTGNTTCISVDHKDHLYIAENYIVTHNTFIMRHLVRYLITEKVCVTAPTHKALRVLENSSGRKGMTIQSLCGLKPEVDVEDYDIENPSFKVIGEQKMRSYKLVVIDECSMINPGLFTLLVKTAIQCRCKLLFLGDELQIQFVVKKTHGDTDTMHNRISPTFTHTDHQFRLTQIVRQEAGNPLLELFGIIRSDLINDTQNFYQYIINHREEVNATGEGFTILNKFDFRNKVIEMFSSDNFSRNLNYVRLIAFTNKCIDFWNTFIRDGVLNNPQGMITKDDMFTAYRTVFDEYKSPIIINSEDYIVNDVRYYVSDNGLACYCITLRSAFDNKVTPMFKIIDFWDSANMDNFGAMLNAIHYKALTGTDRSRWFRYFRFKDIHLTMTDYRLNSANKNRLVAKDIDYGYGITAHKSQGSTFENVCIDLDDIIYFQTKWGKRIRRNSTEALRLLYVAMSRATKHAYLKL